MPYPRRHPSGRVGHVFAGFDFDFDFDYNTTVPKAPVSGTVPFSTVRVRILATFVAIWLIEMPTSCNYNASRIILSACSVASRSAPISLQKAEPIANSPHEFWTFKHQHLFRYGDDEFEFFHDSRWIFEKNSEIYRTEKYLIIVKLHAFTWWDALRPNSPHKFWTLKAPAFFQKWQ